MGIFKKLAGAFAEGWKKGAEYGTLGRETRDTRKLLYPAELPTFDEIAKGGHGDKRAIVYTMMQLDTREVIAETELSALDFGSNRAAYSELIKKRLVQELEPCEEMAERFTREELASIARERGLSTRGKKSVLAERLADSGYRIDRRKYRVKLFRITERGAAQIAEYKTDEREAITHAIDALKRLDYEEAISTYRKFDSKWGFAHASGKKHTIFAHYDISSSRFTFMERYPMRELINTDDFKRTLRARLIAGLMRGCQSRWELARDFENVCQEKIECPRMIELFGLDDSDEEERNIKNAMRENINASARYALEYYISHLEYLSRRSEGQR